MNDLTRTGARWWLAGGVLLPALVAVSGCGIVESDVEPLGAIRVAAFNTDQGAQIENAQVLVDDVPRASALPVVLGGLPGGEVEVTLRPGLEYPARTLPSVVNPPDTTEVLFEYTDDDLPAEVTIQSDVSDARVIVDEQFPDSLPVGTPFSIASGSHSFSLYREGYRTALPALISRDLEGNEQYTLEFTLTEAEVGTETGMLFPDFTLPDDWGGEHSLGQFRGRIVLLTFWFYDCQPCRDEFPSIEQVFQERAGDGFRVLGVNVGWYQDDQEEFEAIREQLGLTFPLLFNTNGPEWTRFDLGIEQAPANFIVGPTGEIHFRRGQISYELLNEMIDDVLGG